MKVALQSHHLPRYHKRSSTSFRICSDSNLIRIFPHQQSQLPEADQSDVNTMEQATQEPPVVAPLPTSKPMQLQSMEDFEREQDALDAEKARVAKAKQQPLPKRAKKTVDLDALAAEQLAREEMGNTNWVGRLQEYRNAHPVSTPGLTYSEATLTSGIVRFSYAVSIAETSQQFGGDAVSFSNKKDAKQFAAKRAIDWLIANSHMPSDGSVRFPKPPPPVQGAQPKKAKAGSPSDPSTPTNIAPITTTYASQIPPLCHKLGFAPPRYEITRAKSDDVPFFNGYADFGGDPRIEGKVGEVFNVYGQKRAKEQIAGFVYNFLKDIERQRGELLNYDDKKRKRSSDQQEKGEQDTAKSVKVTDE